METQRRIGKTKERVSKSVKKCLGSVKSCRGVVGLSSKVVRSLGRIISGVVVGVLSLFCSACSLCFSSHFACERFLFSALCSGVNFLGTLFSLGVFLVYGSLSWTTDQGPDSRHVLTSIQTRFPFYPCASYSFSQSSLIASISLTIANPCGEYAQFCAFIAMSKRRSKCFAQNVSWSHRSKSI